MDFGQWYRLSSKGNHQDKVTSHHNLGRGIKKSGAIDWMCDSRSVDEIWKERQEKVNASR